MHKACSLSNNHCTVDFSNQRDSEAPFVPVIVRPHRVSPFRWRPQEGATGKQMKAQGSSCSHHFSKCISWHFGAKVLFCTGRRQMGTVWTPSNVHPCLSACMFTRSQGEDQKSCRAPTQFSSHKGKQTEVLFPPCRLLHLGSFSK